ncbi:MAG: hypothetical protein IKV16_02385, partial [Clostridia bacterium]|nr:hypothetical protein [Clostridia bacterium]
LFVCLFISLALISCTGIPGLTMQTTCTNHVDKNADAKCDNCGAAVTVVCNEHTDANHDGVCDTVGCDEELEIEHEDANHNGRCDSNKCRAIVEIVHIDKNHDGICDSNTCHAFVDVVHVDNNNDNVCDGCQKVLVEAPAPDNSCIKCVDADYNGKCDVCQKDVESEGIALILNGKLKCSIVVASDLTLTQSKAVYSLAADLEELGYKIDILEDSSQTITDGTEILIGKVKSRGKKYTFDPHDLGYDGYAVKSVDNKILVLGGSDAALKNALNHLADKGFGITGTNFELNTAVLLHKDECENKMTYNITGVSIGGTDIKGYVIAYDSAPESQTLANNIQSQLYKSAGYWLNTMPIDEVVYENYIAVKVSEKTGGEGFYITRKGINLEIVSEFSHLIYEKGEDYFKDRLDGARGSVSFDSIVLNIRDVNYEMFGAHGEGDLYNDVPAIRACHEYANKYGHNVVLNKGKTYYIGPTNLTETIHIKTNVDFGDAHFIIDDRDIASSDPLKGIRLFTITMPGIETLTFDKSDILKAINASGGLTTNTTQLDLGLGYPALLKVINSNKKVYIRYGANENSGTELNDIVLIDENGNIDPTTPFIYDFEQVTKIQAFRTDVEPMTISGGVFTQRANQADSDNKTYCRNFAINRSNLTIKDLTYQVTDERLGDYEGDPYESFLRVEYANNVRFYNCKLDAHRTYYIPGTSTGMGSKVLNATTSNNIVWEKCVQTNMFTDETETETTKNLWGIMSSNFSKNLAYIDSTLSRFDAHCGIYNATITGSRTESVRIVGEGTLLVENSEIFANNISNTVVSTREDYGSFWRGTIIFRNVHMHTRGSNPVVFFVGHWYNHDFGYPTELAAEIIIDNFTVDKDLPVKLFSDTFVTELDSSLTIDDCINPMTPPKKVTIKNSPNTQFVLPTTSEFFKDTEFIIQ